MGETPEKEAESELLRLAGEVADGRPVDWASFRTDPGSASWIKDLQSIAAMAEAMRQEPRPVARAEGLAPGSLLGRFRIERKAESGGMGVVYLARDQVLDRQVALKVLPPDVTHSPERLAQLAREAKLLASMNHPNIATIHGMEEGDRGLRFLVLEWVPGETLAARLRSGPLPVREALEVCGQIAQALTTAHSGGLIHRDLKPANIMFAAGDRVKVVDFGLARRTEVSEGPCPGEARETVAGTWGYLSPECLTGADDHRADIFAFGCVLYECLAGAPAFPGATAEEIHDAVLHSEPDPSRLPAGCPPSIRRLIATCVRKDPEQRPMSMSEATNVIETAIGRRTAAHPASRTNLPRHATSFIGRGAELDRCRKLLGPGRLLTLTGPGGAGKTRLALATAEAVEPAFADGAWFVDLVPVQEGTRVADALADSLRLNDDPRVPTLERIIRHLRGKQALVVLDNCEHVADACAAIVRELLAWCPEVSVLATSRAPLRIAGEQAIVIEPLPVPAEREFDDPAALARCDSVCLFLERAQEADPNFLPDGASLQAAGEICRRVEGLPLAIELAAARVRVLSIGEIATRLDQQIQLLRDGTGRMTPRHRALHATIAWSVEQLHREEILAFRALAAFAGGWDLEAATYVCQAKDEFETLDLISSLVDKSLVFVVHAKAGVSRYRYLEPVRQFALGELAASDLHPVVRQRHLEYFLRLAEEAEPRLYGHEQGRWLERLAADHANLLAALDECYHDEHGVEQGLRLAGALGRYWHVRGYAELGASQLDRMLRRDGAGVPGRARAQALSMAGALASWRGQLEPASEVLEEALTIFRALADRRGEARALLTLGSVCCNLGDMDRGQAISEQGIEASREVGDLRGVATALINLGVMAYGRGDKATAHRLFGEAADLHRRSGDRVTLALALGNRSALSVHLGDHAAARSELTEALQLSLELNAVWGGTSAIATAGMLAQARGDGESATWMLGAVTSCVEKSGLNLSASQRHEMEQLVAQARRSLEEESFTRAWQEGLSLTFPEAAARVVTWLSHQTDQG